MVDLKSVEKQLKRVKFDTSVWNRAEAKELSNILLPEEKITECANGIYENGFALLVATNVRVLLIDKKPLNFLTVEDLRFDTINEIDYSHRMLGATITITAGSKILRFKSYNQPRLRKLINHVQHRMQEIKEEASEKTENQQQHLEEINKQLQMYLLAQHQQFQQQIQQGQQAVAPPSIKPDPQLSDYLFAQRLLEQFRAEAATQNPAALQSPVSFSSAMSTTTEENQYPLVAAQPFRSSQEILNEELVAEGQREIFGKAMQSAQQVSAPPTASLVKPAAQATATATKATSLGLPKSLEINALKIAYSKLPMMLRNRKFGRPSYQAHTQAASVPTPPTQ